MSPRGLFQPRQLLPPARLDFPPLGMTTSSTFSLIHHRAIANFGAFAHDSPCAWITLQGPSPGGKAYAHSQNSSRCHVLCCPIGVCMHKIMPVWECAHRRHLTMQRRINLGRRSQVEEKIFPLLDSPSSPPLLNRIIVLVSICWVLIVCQTLF